MASQIPSPNAARLAEVAVQPVLQFVTVENLRLAYVTLGDGPPVVLLHGNPGTHSDFAAVAEALAGDHRVLSFDRPGHGASERPRREPATIEVQARLLHGALTALGVERPLLVGASWGGTLVLVYALLYPDAVSGLVLVGAVTQPIGSYKPIRNRLLTLPILGDIVRRTVWIPLGRRWVRQTLAAACAPDPVCPEHVEEAVDLWCRPRAAKAAAEDTMTLLAALPSLVSRYPEIRAPLVILTGDADPFTSAEAHAEPLHRALPHSRLVVLERTGHAIPVTRPQAVVAAVRLAGEQLPVGGS